jgi:hypothetical protein
MSYESSSSDTILINFWLAYFIWRFCECILGTSQNCFKPLLALPCQSVPPSFLKEQIGSNCMDFHYIAVCPFCGIRLYNSKLHYSLIPITTRYIQTAEQYWQCVVDILQQCEVLQRGLWSGTKQILFVLLFWVLCGFCGAWGFFDKIIFFIALRSAVQRVFCGYMKSVILSQQCVVTTFGEGVYCIVLQEGQSVTVHLISHLTERRPALISLNIVLDISRH